MSNLNGTTKWIAILVSVIIAMTSIAVGVIRTSNKERIDDLARQVQQHQDVIQQMKETQIRLDMRLNTIEKQTASIDKKLDILLEKKNEK